MTQPHNFSGGPGALPEIVLEQLAEAIHSVDGQGISVLGMSHRSDWFQNVVDEAESHLRALMGLSDQQRVVFMQGGGTAQFAMIPLLFSSKPGHAEYLYTGYWSGKAIAEAQKLVNVRIPWSGEKHGFRRLPETGEMTFSPDAAYLHYVSNETVEGLCFSNNPGITGVPRICDMSSDFCSLPIETAAFDLIYAHAQKNLGPAGVTIAVVNEQLLENAPDNLPTVLDYRPQIKARSINNTPPVFAIYATLLVLRWLRYEVGGLETMEKINQRKAAQLYEALDNFRESYMPWAHTRDRSKMNVVFHLRRPERISGFLQAAESAGLHGLEGHRSIGGLRASLYNAVTESSVLALIDFLDRQRRHLK